MIGLCSSIASVIGRGGKFIGRGSVLGAIFSICWIEPAIFGIENNDSNIHGLFCGKMNFPLSRNAG